MEDTGNQRRRHRVKGPVGGGAGAAAGWRGVRGGPGPEQSGVGASLTLHSPVKVTPWTPDDEFQQSGDGLHPVIAYAAEGTPGDCCILALETLTTGVDLVVSGINSGSNCGWDVMVSGTVGGAVQGFNRGRNTIAVSVGSVTAPRYDVAGRLLEGLSRRLSQREGEPMFLNLNVPNVAPEDGEGNQGHPAGRPILPRVRPVGNYRGRRQGLPHRPQPPRQPDAGRRLRHPVALKDNYVSITPLKLGMGDDASASRRWWRCWKGWPIPMRRAEKTRYNAVRNQAHARQRFQSYRQETGRKRG